LKEYVEAILDAVDTDGKLEIWLVRGEREGRLCWRLTCNIFHVGSNVGTWTGYGLGWLGFNSQQVKDFSLHSVKTGSAAHPASSTMGTRGKAAGS
jgi:hypothetical protein